MAVMTIPITMKVPITVDMTEAQAYMDQHIKPVLKACARDRAQLVRTLQEARAFIIEGHIDLALVEIDTTLAYYTLSAILDKSEL